MYTYSEGLPKRVPSSLQREGLGEGQLVFYTFESCLNFYHGYKLVFY